MMTQTNPIFKNKCVSHMNMNFPDLQFYKTSYLIIPWVSFFSFTLLQTEYRGAFFLKLWEKEKIERRGERP